MPDVTLTISGPSGINKAALIPEGTIIGRDSKCDIILNHQSVSRLHARIYRDAFGSWIIEDLDSHNGILIENQRVKSHTLVSDQKFLISCYTLALHDETEGRAADNVTRKTLTVINRGADEDVVPYRPGAASLLGPALLSAFNGYTEQLSKLTCSADLYSQACHHLAGSIQAFVAIVRLSCQAEGVPPQPEVLAYQVPRGDSGSPGKIPGIQLSRCVLKAACSTNEPVMVQSHPGSHQDLSLTIVNESAPCVVFAAPVNKMGGAIDLLYVDLPAGKMSPGMFDFIEAISRQIHFIQLGLFIKDLEKKEQALLEANRELKEKDRIKDEYVHRVTHDIKGHLGVITGCLSIAGEESDIGSPEKKAEFVARAHRRTSQLSDFVIELLRLTKLRLSGQMELKPFSLREAIANSLKTVSPQASDKHITLGADVAPEIDTMTGDDLSITEVVTNLLFNAIKYTPEHESVSLRALVRDDQIEITIRDTGIGIPPDEIDQVFDEFFRASNAVAFEKEGSGLGLALVKQIVERNCGVITVENNADKGAAFTVTFPAGLQ